MNEMKLVKRAIKGNKNAFEELLVIHSDQLYRTAFLYVGNREDALDIVQETAYKALLAVGQLKNERFFLTWLTKILIHCAFDVMKKKKKEIPIEKIIDLSSGKIEKRDEHLDLVRAINQLKEHYRNAVILFYFQDLPISEVARIMNVPENTVKTYLHRGKNQLKKLLGGVTYNGEKTISSGV
ncbi:sigma-70 family RNA polymerase sigma factor [Peribacillus frigoritolerans]|uniref:sigma-70 family RNA polymerase sigma factor n=1 Tax=Peribacillus frigoritolerans TaxID=450367 RepID=UPI00207AF8D0|nr:sigma-70 family RNA polymerase sigma factor [Peribacillus frigoritolerans]USK64326.1 sigma-70 family RNA polymerase sigma factor [Peribacillus frigoritolerans]